MKSGLIMKISALLMAAVTIYVLVLWEPNDSSVNNEDLSKMTDMTENNAITSNDDGILDLNEFNSEEVAKNDNEVNSNDEGSSSNILQEENISTEADISVDLNYILEQVSLNERIKISSILNKMSVSDYSRFVTLLSNKEDNEGVIKAFGLLKKRISIEDYTDIHELLNNYVDFSVIDVEV